MRLVGEALVTVSLRAFFVKDNKMLWVYFKILCETHGIFLQSSQENLSELLGVKFMKVLGGPVLAGVSNSQSKL